MKNAYTISSLARQLIKASEKLDSLAMGVQDTEQNASGVSELFQGLLLDEVEHVQILTLELTKVVSVSVDDSDGAGSGEGSGEPASAPEGGGEE